MKTGILSGFFCTLLISALSLEGSFLEPTKRYFIVQCDEYQSTSSCLIPMESSMLDFARELIGNRRNGTPINKSLVVHVAYAESNTLNRNYLGDGTRWSWEVSEVVGFFDFGYPVGTGAPSAVEEDVASYVETTFGIFQPMANIVGELPINPDFTTGPSKRSSLWFGRYDDTYYPWIHHQELGWLLINGFDPKSIWMYSPSIDWFWTSEDYYPWVWLHQRNSWAYHNRAWLDLHEVPSAPIQFTLYGSGEVITYPVDPLSR
jgi:hypothetical protein